MNPVLVKPEADDRSQVVLRGRVDEELSRTPWRQCLSREQRTSLLALIQTMSPPLSATEGDCPGEEVRKLLVSAAEPISAAAPAAR